MLSPGTWVPMVDLSVYNSSASGGRSGIFLCLATRRLGVGCGARVSM